jgi:hypothetical protein
MKNTALFLFFTLVIFSSFFSQSNNNDAKKEINKKAMKLATKEAKKLRKSGWDVSPGSLPLEKLLEQAYIKAELKTDKGGSKYLNADGNGVGETRTAAEAQALAIAKLALASQVESNIGAIISTAVGNEQLNNNDAASITKVISNSKEIIAQNLGYIEPSFKISRVTPGNKNNTEVSIKIFYEVEQSMKIAKKIIKEELKDKLQMQEQQLDKLMGIGQ